MTLVRPWVPLLRALRQAGWDRDDHRRFGEYSWRRGGTRNLQQITFNLSGASVSILGRTYTTTEMDPVEARVVLTLLGAFGPAPERIDYRVPVGRAS